MGQLNLNDTHTTWLFRGLWDELSNLIEHMASNENNYKSLSSIGCSSGEEVYSIIALMDDAGISDVKVNGYDNSKRILKKARKNRFPSFSKRMSREKEGSNISDDKKQRLEGLLDKYFKTDYDSSHFMESGFYFKYKPTFDYRDIAKTSIDKSDVVICRNLIRYFEHSEDDLKKIYDNIEGSLNNGGILVIDKPSANVLMKLPQIRESLDVNYCQKTESGTGYVFYGFKSHDNV